MEVNYAKMVVQKRVSDFYTVFLMAPYVKKTNLAKLAITPV